MTLLEIESFLAVVKAGSITAAAQKLYITQPALSRRLQALEQELGYCLFYRQKGIRAITLTPEGAAFIAVAEKWKAVWAQARDIGKRANTQSLQVGAIGSVSTYLLPPVFQRFLQENPSSGLRFHSCQSFEAYRQIEAGQLDLALISDDMYAKTVKTIPLFREKMVLLTGIGAKFSEATHPSQLDGSLEIRLPWNPECDAWHEFWFDGSTGPKVFLDQMSLLEFFLTQQDSWAIAPMSCAMELTRTLPLRLRQLDQGPPDRIIYLLVGAKKKPAAMERFLQLLHRHLQSMQAVDCLLQINP